MYQRLGKKGKTQHVILGVDMWTSELIEKLKNSGRWNISVIDYDAEADKLALGSTIFYSPNLAKQELVNSKKIVFHKFLDPKMRG
ncbi:hypothetical protein [Psychrobacillus sp. OK032]|uniref:hypothetical protein n=1 Tax=Psychrobacillus sp. OK032 TaxID=1884358 RepID=UPI0008D6D111|nr:hypothetical protein [Psychrobacillus sp. OK032]SER71314.1 hypothetical protein SAMN05518872_101723 [Psychrobacillus sp. OK032]